MTRRNNFDIIHIEYRASSFFGHIMAIMYKLIELTQRPV